MILWNAELRLKENNVVVLLEFSRDHTALLDLFEELQFLALFHEFTL